MSDTIRNSSYGRTMTVTKALKLPVSNQPQVQEANEERQILLDVLEGLGGIIQVGDGRQESAHDALRERLASEGHEWAKFRYYAVVRWLFNAGYVTVQPHGKAQRPRFIRLLSEEEQAEALMDGRTNQKPDRQVPPKATVKGQRRISESRAAIIDALEARGGRISARGTQSATDVLQAEAYRFHKVSPGGFRQTLNLMRKEGVILKDPPEDKRHAKMWTLVGAEEPEVEPEEIEPEETVDASPDEDGVQEEEQEQEDQPLGDVIRAEFGELAPLVLDIPPVSNFRKLADELLIAVAEKLAGESPEEIEKAKQEEIERLKVRLGESLQFGSNQKAEVARLEAKLSALSDLLKARQAEIGSLKSQLEVVGSNVQAMLKGEHDGGRAQRALEKFMQQTPHNRTDRERV